LIFLLLVCRDDNLQEAAIAVLALLTLFPVLVTGPAKWLGG
jgi:hypothetical protein